MLNQNDFLYQLNGDFNLSSLIMDWVQMPLLSLSNNQIKRIETDNFKVFRRYQNDELKTVQTHQVVPQISNLTQNLWYLTAEDIRHAVHFIKQDFPHNKKYEITTFNGVIYIIDIFYNDHEFWFNIQLDQEKITSQSAKALLLENKILYDGWFFKINEQTANSIVNFTL